jgi:plastocyanin
MFRVSKLIAAVAISAAVAACGGSDTANSARPAAPPPGAKKVDSSTAGSIAGKVTIEGTVPPASPISMSSDPACASANKDGAVSDTFVVKDGGLDNVFVYIKDDLGAKYLFDTPTTPATIDQKGCHYVPHVLGVRVGQPLQITNDDSTMHTVHGSGRSNQEFNFSQPMTGLKNTVAFTTPEVLLPVKCDVHPWMHAFIGVVNHPYFAVTNNGGTFDLSSVPPGTYTVEAVHEKLGTQTQTVTLGDKEKKEITFTFKAG